MAAQIGADFGQTLESMNTPGTSLGAAGVGSRDTQVDGLHACTTTHHDAVSN